MNITTIEELLAKDISMEKARKEMIKAMRANDGTFTVTLRNGQKMICFPKKDTSPEQFKWISGFKDAKEFELLQHNAHFILEHKDLVFADSRIFFAPVNIQSGAAYIGAFRKPTLGTYVEWWVERGNDELALFVSGSPLSGANVSKAVNKNGKLVDLKPNGIFSNLIKEFNTMHRQYDDIRDDVDAYALSEAI